MTAEISPNGKGAGACHAVQDTPLSSPATTSHQGGAKESQGARVSRSVHETHPSLRNPRVIPIGDPRGSRGKRRSDAERDQTIGGLLSPAATDHVEQQRARPDTDRDVGKHWVQGMPEPATRQQILRCPSRQRGPDGPAQRFYDPIENGG